MLFDANAVSQLIKTKTEHAEMLSMLKRLNSQLKESLHLHIGEIDMLINKIEGGDNVMPTL